MSVSVYAHQNSLKAKYVPKLSSHLSRPADAAGSKPSSS